jgi:hypothetical protein
MNLHLLGRYRADRFRVVKRSLPVALLARRAAGPGREEVDQDADLRREVAAVRVGSRQDEARRLVFRETGRTRPAAIAGPASKAGR